MTVTSQATQIDEGENEDEDDDEDDDELEAVTILSDWVAEVQQNESGKSFLDDYMLLVPALVSDISELPEGCLETVKTELTKLQDILSTWGDSERDREMDSAYELGVRMHDFLKWNIQEEWELLQQVVKKQRAYDEEAKQAWSKCGHVVSQMQTAQARWNGIIDYYRDWVDPVITSVTSKLQSLEGDMEMVEHIVSKYSETCADIFYADMDVCREGFRQAMKRANEVIHIYTYMY